MKEVFATATAPMTTGTVSRADQLQGWFVMVKDRKNDHPDNKLWGDGWGWSSFRRRQAAQNNLNGLQERLPAVSRSRAIHGLDL